MKEKNKEKKKVMSSSRTEAWADMDHFKKEGHVSIPSEEAVEDAKEWVEENEK